MTLVLYWLSFAAAMAGTILATYAFVARRMELCATGLALLAVGLALFGVWSLLTISGFLAGVLLFAAASIGITLISAMRASESADPAPSSPNGSVG